MLLELDDLPVHQAPEPLAHAMGGHPNAYDRFFFNAYREDLYVAVAMGLYPNRGVIDAAVGVVHRGVQRSVFASGPLDGRSTRVGPISIELVQPMRTAVVHVDAPAHGLVGRLEFSASTVAVEEPRQTHRDGARLWMDVTRATQLGRWHGTLEVDGEALALSATLGTKDRSWGVRPVGQPAPAAPSAREPQLFFLWAPLHLAGRGFHLSTFEDARGVPISSLAAWLDPLEAGASPVDPAGVHVLRAAAPRVTFASGLRRASHASLELTELDGATSTIELEPTLTFRMRGIGYEHPSYLHGTWQGGLLVEGEVHDVADLDTTSFHDVHVQEVVVATWQGQRGLGVLEEFAVGPHAPSGLHGLLDGAP